MRPSFMDLSSGGVRRRTLFIFHSERWQVLTNLNIYIFYSLLTSQIYYSFSGGCELSLGFAYYGGADNGIYKLGEFSRPTVWVAGGERWWSEGVHEEEGKWYVRHAYRQKSCPWALQNITNRCERRTIEMVSIFLFTTLFVFDIFNNVLTF